MTTSKVFEKIMSQDQINSIINFYSQQSGFNTEQGIINKHLEYHIPENFIYILLKPVMDRILGSQHVFSTGAYKSSNKPYIIHVDSRIQHDSYSDCMSFDYRVIQDNKAVLIPLVEGREFRTITFKAWSDFNPGRKDIDAKKHGKNNLLPRDFSHDPLFSSINYLEIDIDYQWKLGDILVWDRNQWHMSSNFQRHGKIKEFLILFMA